MSNLVALLIMVTYEVIAFLAARKAYSHIIQEGDSDNAVDRFMVGLMALIAGHFWPLAAPIALVLWKPRKTPEQLLAENEQMKRHIAELERELGIGRPT